MLGVDALRGHLYWSGHPTVSGRKGYLVRAKLDGSDVRGFLCCLERPGAIALDPFRSMIYWTEPLAERIQRSVLRWSAREDLVTTGLERPQGIALDILDAKMYWVDQRAMKIQRAHLDGSGIEDLVTGGLSRPVGIAVDSVGRKMYWTDLGTDSIHRANLDGSDPEVLATSTALTGSIALDRNLPFPRLDVKPGSCPNVVNRRSQGVLRVAIVGTDAFDVRSIEPDSLHLSRADRLAGTVQPVRHGRGKGKRRAKINDVATPFDGEECDCHNVRGDGIDDLVVLFSTRELVEALALGSIGRGDLVGLIVSGVTTDGVPFAASDCITIVGRR